MKFGKQLKLESVPEWQEYYMSYKRLKRIIKKLVLQTQNTKKLNDAAEAAEADENTALLANKTSAEPRNDSHHPSESLLPDTRKEFFAVVESDIDKVNHFFRLKSSEFFQAFQNLRPVGENKINQTQGNQQNNNQSSGTSASSISSSSSSTSNVSSSALPTSSSSPALSEDSSELLSLYRQIHYLLIYSHLNYEGLRKIMKKFDKNCQESLQESLVERMKQECFYEDCHHLKELLQQCEQYYIEREIQRGREFSQAQLVLKQIVMEIRSPKEENQHSQASTVYSMYFWILISIALAIAFYLLPILPEKEIRAHKCLGLLGFVTVLWITEAIPFFVASLTVPFLVITTGILADPITGVELTAERAARTAFAAMFNDTIMLVLGGFSISAAFSKCQFELQLASIIQRLFGTRPRLFLLAFMFLGAFLSMWISNVAAPVLLTSLLLPIVRDFGARNNYARALLLGLAFSCNIGGMMSPISSPQNAIALGYLESSEPDQMISFGQWLMISIPYCSVSVLIAWLYLIFIFLKPQDSIPAIPSIVFEKTRFTSTHLITIFTSVLTILLWCSLSYTRPILGEMGTVAVLPVVLLFGTGVLNKNDLFNFSWHLILLIGGGSVLGAAVNSSRLLQILTDATAPYILGNSLYISTAAVLTLVFFITTFVSHTVAALILTPVIVSIGVQAGHVQVVLMTATLMMSGTQSLPLSSFPNVNSLLIDDDFNRPFLHPGDYLKHGTAVSVALFLLLGTMGYLQCLIVFGTSPHQ